jgi:serine/threonine protein kinase
MSLICPICGKTNRATSKFCAHCRAQLAGILAAGTVLQNRYQIQRLLGHGGMGAVYLAQDNRLGPKPVAVKENFDVSLEAQKQFQFEAHILANLDHPNLPKVTDHFIEPSGRQYLVMEYVEGEDLESIQKRLPQGQLPPQDVLRWADDLLDALDYLHSQPTPIIHRDIKPANIKITPQGKVKLVDFGISKLQQPGILTQTAARSAGSPGFAPVEQYSGGTDARSDVYSLGATLYCLLSGQNPPDATLLAAGQPLLPFNQHRSDVPPHVQAAVLTAMAVNAGQRFQSAAAFRQALRQPQPQAVAGTSKIVPQQRRSARRKWPFVLAGLATVAGLLIVAALLLLNRGIDSDIVNPAVVAAATGTLPVAVETADSTPALVTTTDDPTGTATATLTGSAPTVTPSPRPIQTQTATPTQSPTATEPPPDEPANLRLTSDDPSGLRVFTQASAQAGIRVEIRYSSGAAKTRSWVGIYAQDTDVSGNPVKGRRLTSGRTDDTGVAFFALEPGTYAVELGDLTGTSWGHELNYTVTPGNATVLSLTLGQLIVGVRNAEAQAVSGRWTVFICKRQTLAVIPLKATVLLQDVPITRGLLFMT